MKKPIELKISGMHCKSCEILTQEELSLLAGVSEVWVSFEKKLANMSRGVRTPTIYKGERKGER